MAEDLWGEEMRGDLANAAFWHPAFLDFWREKSFEIITLGIGGNERGGDARVGKTAKTLENLL